MKGTIEVFWPKQPELKERLFDKFSYFKKMSANFFYILFGHIITRSYHKCMTIICWNDTLRRLRFWYRIVKQTQSSVAVPVFQSADCFGGKLKATLPILFGFHFSDRVAECTKLRDRHFVNSV
ncbi:MAG: hypothetical protein COA41_15395 [Sphingopyxis sp.]|nr:MAG: hypothetical protein COA41_15395 [Sphingopyxis sp.]